MTPTAVYSGTQGVPPSEWGVGTGYVRGMVGCRHPLAVRRQRPPQRAAFHGLSVFGHVSSNFSLPRQGAARALSPTPLWHDTGDRTGRLQTHLRRYTE